MKSYIVSISLIFLFTIVLCYGEDYNGYMHEQLNLKAVAEECAAGGILEIDIDSYANGILDINRKAAVNYAHEHFINYLEKICRYKVEDYEIGIHIYDSRGEYVKIIKKNGDLQEREINTTYEYVPAITVTLTVYTENLIRGGFIDLTKISREAHYEMVLP